VSSPSRVSEALRASFVAAALLGAVLPVRAVAGSLRVGPTRLELSARRPVVVLEVQNTGGAATLAQLETFAWRQEGAGDLLEPTTDIIATPAVMELAPGETRLVRVGSRLANSTELERSYRVFVREVPPAVEDAAVLRFALRIGVPVFALPAQERVLAVRGGAGSVGSLALPPGLTRAGGEDPGWRWMPPDIQGCAGIQLVNPSARHERVLAAEMLSAGGEVLWRSAEPVYVLARSRRLVLPALCAPATKEAALLRLTLESRTVTLPVEAPSLIVDANAH